MLSLVCIGKLAEQTLGRRIVNVCYGGGDIKI
jgi:hypothetical protein